MNKIIIYSFLFFLIQGCAKKEIKIPADVMSADTMVAVIADMQLAEATIQLRNLGYTDSTKNQAYGCYKYVFLQHKIDFNSFSRSFHFYSSHPDLMSKIYTDALTVLSQKQVKTQELQKAKMKRDSIK